MLFPPNCIENRQIWCFSRRNLPNRARKLIEKLEIAARCSLFGWVELNGFWRKGTEIESSVSGFGAQDLRLTTRAIELGCSESSTSGLGELAGEMDSPNLTINIGCKTSKIAILPTKSIKYSSNRIAIATIICNPAAVMLYLSTSIRACTKKKTILYPQTPLYLFYQSILQFTLHPSFYFYIQPNKII